MKQRLFLFAHLVVISLYFFSGNLNCYAQLSDDSFYAYPTNLNTLLSMGEKELSDVSQKNNLTFLINSKTDLRSIQRLERFEQLKIVFEVPTFPEEFSSIEFSQLRTIEFLFKPEFKRLKGFGDMNCPKLTTASLHFRDTIEHPEEIGKLTQLENLFIEDYRNETLPNNLDQLTQLKHLRIAAGVKHFPSLSKLTELKILHINCAQLESMGELPLDSKIQFLYLLLGPQFHESVKIERLKRLELFNVSGTNWEVIPSNWSKTLTNIGLVNMPNLRDVRNLKRYTNLQSVQILQTGLRTFDLDMSGLKKLKQLSIDHNEFLVNVQGIGSLATVEKFKLSNLPNLQRIDFDMSRSKFEHLTLEKLPKLRSIEGIGTCSNLASLTIDWTGLTNLPQSMYLLTKLETLNISHCPQMQSIDGLVNMASLKQFSMYECDTLTAIPSLFNTNLQLKQVHLEFMQSLTNIDGVAGLPNLDFFFIRALPNCTTLPKKLSQCESLSVICIETPVTDVSPIHDLMQLKHLRIMYSLEALPESLFTNPYLEKLEIAQSRIVDASALEQFTELKELRLNHNPEMNVYPDLTKFPKLELSFIDGKISRHYPR